MSAFARTESSALLLGQGETDTACQGLAEVVDVWYRAGEWSQQWLTLTRCVIALATIGRSALAAQVVGAIETRAVVGTPPVMAILRDRVLTTTDRLQTELGPDRYDELYRSGVDLPIADVVHRTRAALLGTTTDES